MKEHVCTLRQSIDRNNAESSESLDFHAWKRSCLRMFRISENTPRTKLHVHSIAAVHTEARRHISLNYWWIIHPFSTYRFVFDFVMTIIYLISFLTIPYSVSFVIMSQDRIQMDNVNLLIYAFCWLEIICNCITGYYNRKTKITELRPLNILAHYLRTYLIFDILSSLPWDRITLPWRRLPGKNSNYLIVLINLLPCLKLLRYNYVDSQIYELFTKVEGLYLYYEMASTFMMAFCIMYWSTCLCYIIPVLVLHFSNSLPEDYTEYWITGLDSDSNIYRFQSALFIVVQQLTASGHGLHMPVTDGYLILSCCLLIIGNVLECYIAVMLIQIKAGRMAPESKFQEIMNQVCAYARQRQLPKQMLFRIQTYYYYRFRRSFFREKLILSSLSEQLREEIALRSSHRLVENVAIFKALPKNILRSIVRNLKFELYLPSDVIIKAGAHGDCMFFLSAGTVAVLTPTGKEICHLDDGAHFGEVALLVPDQRRVASIIAIEVCEVYRLDRKDFRKCIAVHTQLFARIERIATERIDRATLVEEQHKRLMRGSVQMDRNRFIK